MGGLFAQQHPVTWKKGVYSNLHRKVFILVTFWAIKRIFQGNSPRIQTSDLEEGLGYNNWSTWLALVSPIPLSNKVPWCFAGWVTKSSPESIRNRHSHLKKKGLLQIQAKSREHMPLWSPHLPTAQAQLAEFVLISVFNPASGNKNWNSSAIGVHNELKNLLIDNPNSLELAISCEISKKDVYQCLNILIQTTINYTGRIFI